MRLLKTLQTLLCVLLVTVLPARTMAAELTVAVATNFYTTAELLAAAYTQESGTAITLISGSTGKLYAQIINGAPIDLFLAADAERPQRLEQQGLARGVAFTYALGRLVLWSSDATLLAADRPLPDPAQIRHLAIANPQLAPYGRAAIETLTHLGVLAAWQPQLVRGENIGQTYQFVASGNAQLGFIARSQWQPGSGSHWLVPAEAHAPIVQQAVALSDAPAAQDFAAWLQSAAARQLIQAAGYDLPEYAHADRQ